jgi:hypothetical protein
VAECEGKLSGTLTEADQRRIEDVGKTGHQDLHDQIPRQDHIHSPDLSLAGRICQLSLLRGQETDTRHHGEDGTTTHDVRWRYHQIRSRPCHEQNGRGQGLMIYWFLGISSVLLLAIAIHLYDRHLQKKIEEWEKNQKDE